MMQKDLQMRLRRLELARRSKELRTVADIHSNGQVSSTAYITMGSGTLYLTPMLLRDPIQLARVTISIAAGSTPGAITLALYKATSSAGSTPPYTGAGKTPQFALVKALGTKSVSASAATLSFDIPPLPLDPSVHYFLVAWSSGADVRLRQIDSGQALPGFATIRVQTGAAFGAFPQNVSAANIFHTLQSAFFIASSPNGIHIYGDPMVG
jgi:hypothetical protein